MYTPVKRNECTGRVHEDRADRKATSNFIGPSESIGWTYYSLAVATDKEIFFLRGFNILIAIRLLQDRLQI